MTEFKEGQLVLYKGVNGYEIGKIKRIRDDNQAFVWYHGGDTVALTDLDLLQPIINDHCIQEIINKGEDKVQTDAEIRLRALQWKIYETMKRGRSELFISDHGYLSRTVGTEIRVVFSDSELDQLKVDLGVSG